MNGDIRIQLSLPATTFTTTSTYVKIKYASGFEYTMLKLIDYGLKSSADLKLSDLMSLASIPEEMLPFVLNEVERMKSEFGLLDCQGRITGTTPVKKMALTASGTALCHRGMTTSEPRRLEYELTYFPARTKVFQKNDGVRVLREKLTPDNVDEEELTAFVKENKVFFDLDEDSEFVTKIRAKEPRSFIYQENILVGFDEDAGLFQVKEMISGIRSGILSSLNITGDEIIGKLPSELFSLPKDIGFTPGWNSIIPSKSRRFILPKEFTVPEGKVFYNSNREPGNVNDWEPAAMECDMAVINNAYEGYQFWFVSRENPLQGFENVSPTRMVVRHKMSPTEIKDFASRTSSAKLKDIIQ